MAKILIHAHKIFGRDVIFNDYIFVRNLLCLWIFFPILNSQIIIIIII